MHREQEQCFIGHAYSPFRLHVFPKGLIGVSSSEAISWLLTSSYFEDLFFNFPMRQDALPKDADPNEMEIEEENNAMTQTTQLNGMNNSYMLDKSGTLSLPPDKMERSGISERNSSLNFDLSKINVTQAIDLDLAIPN